MKPKNTESLIIRQDALSRIITLGTTASDELIPPTGQIEYALEETIYHFPAGMAARFLRVDLLGNDKSLWKFDDERSPVSPQLPQGEKDRVTRQTSITIELPDSLVVSNILARRDGSAIRIRAPDSFVIPRKATIETYYTRPSGKNKIINKCVLYNA